MYAPELEAQDRRHRVISGIITTAIMAILLLLSLIWTAYRERVPPVGEGDYEMLGAIDFGNRTQGSRQVNNFEKPVEDPAPTPQPEAARPIETPQVAETTPQPVKEVTTEAPSPVVQPPPPKEVKDDPIPKPPATVKPPEPKPKTEDTQNDTGTSSTSSPTTQPTTPSDKPTGSNHGNADSGTGNAGTPDVKTLDPKGLYTFGTGGDGGLKGRSAISLPYPAYNAQEEGRLTYEFYILPDGTVQPNVKAVGIVTKLALRDAGIAAIKKWKFTAGPNRIGPIRVSILFKLKG